jgi:hypothetical protein
MPWASENEPPSAKRQCFEPPEKQASRKRVREPEAVDVEKVSRAALPPDMQASSTPPCFAHRLASWCVSLAGPSR